MPSYDEAQHYLPGLRSWRQRRARAGSAPRWSAARRCGLAGGEPRGAETRAAAAFQGRRGGGAAGGGAAPGGGAHAVVRWTAPSMSAGAPTDHAGLRFQRRIRATLELGVIPARLRRRPAAALGEARPGVVHLCMVSLPNITPLRLVT